MARPCPWCLEPAARGSATCGTCGRALLDDAGHELRPVDIRWKKVEAAQWEKLRLTILAGTPAVAAFALAAPMVPLLAPLVTAILAAGHLVALRVVVLRTLLPLLGGRRRMLCRWTSRLAVLWIGVPGYSLTLVPIGGAALAAATFAGVTVLIHWYGLRSLYRERDRAAPPTWEMVAVLALVVVTACVALVLLVLALLLGWSVVEIMTWLGERL